MERRRYYVMEYATLWVCLFLAAALRCSAGRVFSTRAPASCVVDSCKSFNAVRKSALDSTAATQRLVRWSEKSGGDNFLMDYSYNPGSPRPVPQAPRGHAPRIGVPPSPPINESTPQVPPSSGIVTPSPLPPPPALP